MNLRRIKAVYKFKLKEDGYCKHIELRMKDCQTALPPSNHESGGIYIFLYNDPTELPAEIEFEKIVQCFEKFCVIKSKT